MSRPIGIIGAGGYGRELLEYAEDATADGWGFHVEGFFDDDGASRDGWSGPPLLGGVDEVSASAIDHFVVAVGVPAVRRRFARLVAAAGKELTTVRHPTAYVSRSASVGSGTILCPNSLIGSNANVGSNVSINVYSSIGHDVWIGSDGVISPHAAVSGGAHLGDGIFLGSHATIAPGVRIGGWSQVVAASFVKNEMEVGSLVHGNPAAGRVLYRVPKED